MIDELLLGSESESPERLDVSSEEWTEKLAEGQVYVKNAIVKAEVVLEPEEVDTVLIDGTLETREFAEPGQIEITNPDGEEYVMDADDFEARYKKTSIDGVYKSCGMIRAVPNPTGKCIEIMAPWGKPQFGEPDCFIATAYHSDNPNEVGSHRYIIGGRELHDTYVLPKEETQEQMAA